MGDLETPTYKLLEAISIGKIPVLKIKWLERSISNKQLEPIYNKYLVKKPVGILFSIKSNQNCEKKLFIGLNFVIIGSSKSIPIRKKHILINNLGGTIVKFNEITKRIKKDSTQSRVRVDYVIAENGRAKDEDVVLSKSKLVNLKWLVDSILKYEIQDMSLYPYIGYTNTKRIIKNKFTDYNNK